MSLITLENITFYDDVTIKNTDCFTYISMSETAIPYQGWKIHISATLENYQDILTKTMSCCYEEHISFKFINNTKDLLDIFSKKSSPIEVGKFITIYPENDKKFLKILELLHNLLDGFQGIQILTDHRYKNSNVLFYRYGVMNATLINGERPLLKDLEGNTYPDIQGPYYECPSFIEELFPDKSYTSAHDNNEIKMNNRYIMKSIIHQTGSGNVYIAFDILNEENVIVKEARKNVYINEDISAIDLLQNEYHTLSTLQKSFIPKVIDEFFDDENYYLVEEYIRGERLDCLKNKFNLLLSRPSIEHDLFCDNISAIITQMFEKLELIHKEGILLEDISTSNMILDSEDNLYFIDFETAYSKKSDMLVETTNNHYPSHITSKFEKRDRIKLWYSIIDLLTNATSLLKFDKSGFSTVKSFLKMSYEMNFPIHIIQLFLNDFNNEKQFDLSTLISTLPNINLELLDFKRVQILETLLTVNSFEIPGTSLLDTVDNYLAVKYYDLPSSENNLFDEILQDKQNDNIETVLAKLILKKDSYKKHLDFLDKIIYSNNTNYKYKYRVLQILNNHDGEETLFRETVKSIKITDISFEKGIPYIKLDQYLSPYLTNGNSGLIIELIKFSLKHNTTEFDDFIKILSLGIDHTYAKSTSLNTGLAGLGLANAWLYFYFNDIKYLNISVKIFNHIYDYSIYKANKLVLIDPLQEKINYSYANGMLGQYYFIDHLLTLIKKGK
ncbi:class III lanthionine synthetase LanKC N-terminal domain-containing protein [Streptococcus cuniculipharyngis]|uniref:Kinase n=1 Tax=Streptococcus cuniculipharyngis TaxID=1562651 RepID=A0A5C5SCP0_9STRE|nr:kinase [Streptococcus cuniculipharyngis]TWS97150.1 kinase [Streptococcus cuniculipharyngis]